MFICSSSFFAPGRPSSLLHVHLLTVFSNNTAEQERYYIRNMLKKPQQVSICQFVQHVEQLNSYIKQLPYWYYSLSTKPCTTLMNVPFAKADLASQVLWMRPHTWLYQFNLAKIGMTPVDMRLLLFSLEAIERVFVESAKVAMVFHLD
jgi:hypothetical protein